MYVPIIESGLSCSKNITGLVFRHLTWDLKSSFSELTIGIRNYLYYDKKIISLCPYSDNTDKYHSWIQIFPEEYKINEIIIERILVLNNEHKDYRIISREKFNKWEKSIRQIPMNKRNFLLQDLCRKNFISQEFLKTNGISNAETTVDTTANGS